MFLDYFVLLGGLTCGFGDETKDLRT